MEGVELRAGKYMHGLGAFGMSGCDLPLGSCIGSIATAAVLKMKKM